MGSDQSRPLEQWQTAQVAAEVAKLGQHYADHYSEAFLKNGIDGAFLASLTPEEAKESLDDLGIESRLHRRVLEKKLVALKSAALGSSISDDLGPSVHSKLGASGWGDASDTTVDHCRRRSVSFQKTPEETDLDKSEIIAQMNNVSMQDRSEREALLNRRMALENQIRSFDTAAQ